MRDRWYDPRSGTFLTPDPQGYGDSSNLYAYCGGDPVNCSDPTGNAASVSLSGTIIGIRPDGSRYKITRAEGMQDPRRVLSILESDADLGFADQEEILTQAGIPIPFSSACAPGQSCISSRTRNRRAFTHRPRNGKWVEAALVSTTSLPPQTREQEIMSGLVDIGTAVSITSGVVRGRSTILNRSAELDAKYVFDAAASRYRETTTGRFVAPRDLPYPPNAGFATRTPTVLEPGTIIDRYGRPTGRFAGQPGTSISQRGLAPGSENLPYKKYVVLKPVEVEIGRASEVPDFGATGGGTQYLFKKPLAKLVEEGVIEEVP